jgi:hypothetical protein
MKNSKLALIFGIALAMPCLAQNAPAGAGAPAGGGASGGQEPAGMISLKVDTLFSEVDTNKDGKITNAEWKAAGMIDSVFNFIDSKKTGSITLEMLQASKFPADVDANKDGIVTVAEMVAFDKKQPNGGGGGAPPAGGGPGAPKSGGGAPPSGDQK